MKNGNENKICEVVGSGNIDKETKNGDIKKVAVSNLEVIKELTLGDFVNNGIEFIQDSVKQSNTSKKVVSDNGGYSAKIGSSGDYAQIGSSGYYAQISSTGEDCVICCAGNNSIAKGKVGSWITLSEWQYNKTKERYVPVCVKTEYIDGTKIKADTFYKLQNGEFVEVKND